MTRKHATILIFYCARTVPSQASIPPRGLLLILLALRMDSAFEYQECFVKKNLSWFISISLLSLLFASCSLQHPPAPNQADEIADSNTRLVIDAVGRSVEIPSQVERIVPLGNTPRMITYLGLADKVVGIGECEIASSPIHAYAWVNRQNWSDLPNSGTDALGETAYYPEEIILAKPDLILCSYTADVADNIQKQTGIPTISVPQGTLFGEDYELALRLLGDVCGVSERAKSVIDTINNNLTNLRERVKSIDPGDKTSVLAAGATFKGSHSIDGVYTNYAVFELLSANDVAAEISSQSGASGVMVDKEQILLWNPEMIFFDAGSMDLVRNDYSSNPNYFEQLQAVQNGALYQWPNSTWHWTNVEIPLVTAYYVGALLYPEAFADLNFEEKASEIFDFFLGEPNYLAILEEAGAGYGKVNLRD